MVFSKVLDLAKVGAFHQKRPKNTQPNVVRHLQYAINKVVGRMIILVYKGRLLRVERRCTLCLIKGVYLQINADDTAELRLVLSSICCFDKLL